MFFPPRLLGCFFDQFSGSPEGAVYRSSGRAAVEHQSRHAAFATEVELSVRHLERDGVVEGMDEPL